MSAENQLTPVSLSQWIDRLPGGRFYCAPDAIDKSAVPWNTSSRQGGLVRVVPAPLPAHVGLWLDRCLQEDPAPRDLEKPGRAALQLSAVQALLPQTPAREAYLPRYRRWAATVKTDSPTTRRRYLEIRSLSRVLLHPASGTSVTEGSLLLHHTYGVPYLPGSALRGICRARARGLHQAFPERYRELFGEEMMAPGSEGEPRWVNELFGFVESGKAGGLAGLVDFWDALWIPGDPGSPLATDIVNPHQSKYHTREN
ncbi:MAG: hypothetical protein KKC99_09720, partial [Proteobacteria bacterium]|nr:hypothetical protein [Pseudomonadota bacterium]